MFFKHRKFIFPQSLSSFSLKWMFTSIKIPPRLQMPVSLHLWCCTHHQNRMKSQSPQILGEERVFLWLSRLFPGSLCTRAVLQNCPCAWNSLEKVKVTWSKKGCFNFTRQRNLGLRQNNLVWDISWVAYPHQAPRGWLWEQTRSKFKLRIEYSDSCNEKAISSTDFFFFSVLKGAVPLR